MKTEKYKHKKARNRQHSHLKKIERKLKWAKQLLEAITEGKHGVENMIFSDEKQILLDGQDGMQHY